MQSQLSNYLLAATLLVGLSHFSCCQVLAKEAIVLPSPSVLGKQVGQLRPLEMPMPEVKAIFPKNIHLDLDGPVVYGIMADYPADVEFDRLVEAVNVKHKKWTRDPDGEMAKWGVSVWRNEGERYAIQVSESKIIMIWLDRKITQEEMNETALILTQDAMRRAIDAQSSELGVEKAGETDPSCDASE